MPEPPEASATRCVLRSVSAWVSSLAKKTAFRASRGCGVAALLVVAGLGLAGCAQQPQQVAATSHPKEYFPASVYGPASRRVVESGPVPRGGGQYLVGKPYTVAGQTYYPSERKLTQVGNASWYGDAFHGRLTANGEIYDRDSFTAAHPTMPLPSYARVTNLRTRASMIVRVNDRGPFASNRVMDVSRRVAEALDFQRVGTAKVKVEYVGRASLAGSDDARLYASLRTNGPAQWNGEGEPTMIAAAPSVVRVASLAPIAPAPRADPPEARERAPREETERAAVAPVRARPTMRADPVMRAEPAPRVARLEPRDTRSPPHRPAFAAREDAMAALLKQQALASDRPARASARAEPMPPARAGARPARTVLAEAPLPPSRHADGGARVGAGTPVGAFHRGKPALRLSRND